MKKIIFSLALSLSLVAVQAQTNASDSLPKPVKKSKFQLGLNAGAVTGLGLGARYTPSRFMHQVAFLPIAGGGNTFIDVSYSVFYRLVERKHVDFNLYAGDHAMFISGSGMSEVTTVNVTGAGFGFDFKLGNYFSLNLNGGYAVYNTFSSIVHGFALAPAAEIGLYYKL